MEKKTITLYIAQQAFKLSISSEMEGLYREAERKINLYIRQLGEKGITEKLIQLGYTVINFAIKETYLDSKQKFIDTELKQNLKDIEDILQKTLKQVGDQ